VGYNSVSINGTKITAGQNITLLNREIDANRLKHTAPDINREWVVTKKRSMSRCAAGSNTGPNRLTQAADTFSCQLVKICKVCGFQFRFSCFRSGQSAKSVQD